MASSSSSGRLWRGTSPVEARQMHRGGACLFQDSGMRVTLAAVLEEVGEGPCDEPGSSSGCDEELCLVLEPSEGNSPDARRRSTSPFSRSSSCDVFEVLGVRFFRGRCTCPVQSLPRRLHLSHGAPGSSPLRRHLALAVAHTAQALPHFPCWFWEPRAEYSAETGSTLRRFIASAFSNRAGEYGA